ncbi:hypothetical protein [Amycolatopsis sp. NPDC059657]|uniref:hypothetical protein n=1 Tax=Amycolatopsis sp. NPDC059657 TaxID=3346899 RepID=UPI0036729A6C
MRGYPAWITPEDVGFIELLEERGYTFQVGDAPEAATVITGELRGASHGIEYVDTLTVSEFISQAWRYRREHDPKHGDAVTRHAPWTLKAQPGAVADVLREVLGWPTVGPVTP